MERIHVWRPTIRRNAIECPRSVASSTYGGEERGIMSPLPIPTIGSTNVRGFVLPDTCGGGAVCALESLYGNQNPDRFNPLIFAVYGHDVGFPEGAEILFDVIGFTQPTGETIPLASNIRRA
jgi:hypothetical protein